MIDISHMVCISHIHISHIWGEYVHIYISQYIDNVCVCVCVCVCVRETRARVKHGLGEESSSYNQKNIIENDIDLALSWKHQFSYTVISPGQFWLSVQFSRSVVSDSLQPHESQHARPPCPKPTTGVYSNSSSSSRWCHPAISTVL